jgi:hypothetical protein
MQTPTPSPAAPILAASLAQLAELEKFGRAVLVRDTYGDLARDAARLHAALFSLQSDGVQGSDAVDLAALEDACALFQRLDAEARSAAA